MRKFTKILIVGLAMLICQMGVQAQTNGSLSGTVSDPQGAVVAGASVKVTNSETGSERTAATNIQGVFQINELNPGTYTVTVTADFGCTSSCSITVTAFPPPTCSITGSDFCLGGSSQLCAATNSV